MVLGIALEAILHCFILDEDMQKGKTKSITAAAKNTPAPLKEFISQNI